MAVYQNPVGLAAAPVNNQLSELLTFKEKLCGPICVNSNNQPIASVSYAHGTPVINGTTVFVPIIATIQIVSPSNCCKAIPQIITERFTVAFQGQTALPTAVAIASVGTIQGITCVNNGKASGYVINDSITVTITPPAA